MLYKLKHSKLVTSDLNNSIFEGASDLNGNFRTTRTVGDLKCYLYFDWENNKLKQVDLRSDTVSSSEFSSTLKHSWQEMVDLLSMLYGGPRHKSAFPSLSDMASREGIVGTHRWITEHDAEVILGPSKDGGRYFICVRITDGE